MEQYIPQYAAEIVKQIEQADELQLNEIILAVVRRHNALQQHRTAIFLTIPTNPQNRAEELENTINLIRACYNRQDT